jgi:hypothetical protein
MTLLDERTVSRLNPIGVAMLLVYGARLHPPRNGNPGIRVTVDGQGICLLEAVGYPDHAAGNLAICEAAQVCIDAGLVVSFVPRWVDTPDPHLARTVRRRSL